MNDNQEFDKKVIQAWVDNIKLPTECLDEYLKSAPEKLSDEERKKLIIELGQERDQPKTIPENLKYQPLTPDECYPVTHAYPAELLAQQLRKDPELFRAYKDNIAMAFKDEVSRFKKIADYRYINNEAMHGIANRAAENFLNQFIK